MGELEHFIKSTLTRASEGELEANVTDVFTSCTRERQDTSVWPPCPTFVPRWGNIREL